MPRGGLKLEPTAEKWGPTNAIIYGKNIDKQKCRNAKNSRIPSF